MSNIQDIHAFAERIYDIVQDYVNGDYNADDVLAIGKHCGRIIMKADDKEAIKMGKSTEVYQLKDLVRKAGWEDRFLIASKAARRDELGNDTHYGTKAKLRQMGVPFAKRRATLLDRSDYDAYDYLIGMDEENMRDMLRLFGGDPNGKIYKLLRFADEDRDVADPWYTGNFDETYEDVLKGCTALLRMIGKK